MLEYVRKYCHNCCKETDHILLGVDKIPTCSICGYAESLRTFVRSPTCSISVTTINDKNIKHNVS